MLVFPEIKLIQHNTDHGRFYETPEGDFYPSITTVLSSIPNPELDSWKAAIGEAEAAKISKAATTRGTRFHSFCESVLIKQEQKLDVFDAASFTSIKNHLSVIEPIAIEASCYSNKLRVAGTFDCLGYYKNKLCLIDFKTTRKQKYHGEFDTYYMQTAAYAAMVYEVSGIIVPNLLILMQNVLDNETYVFEQKTSDWLKKFIDVRNNFIGEY